jgi:hypothetical protein
MTAVNGIKKIVARIKDLEAQVGQRTYEVACEYEYLVAECEGSFTKAAKVAGAHGLSYSNNGSIGRLLKWAEFVSALNDLSDGGTDHGQHPSEHSMRVLLVDWYWKEAGPDGLAELWMSLDAKKPELFVKAAKDRWPKPGPEKPLSTGTAEAATLKKAIDATSVATKSVLVHDYMAGLRRSKNLAEDLHDMILAKWKTWDAFFADVEANKNND